MSLRPRPLCSQEGFRERKRGQGREEGQGRAFVETRSTSGEVSTPMRFTVKHQQARELGEGLLEDEDLGDLVSFGEMLKD